MYILDKWTKAIALPVVASKDFAFFLKHDEGGVLGKKQD